MGFAYRTFQHIAIEAMEWGRDIGKEVEKQNKSDLRKKRSREAWDVVDTEAIDRHWDNLLQESWDHFHDVPDSRKKKNEVL